MNGIDFIADTNFIVHLHQGNQMVRPFIEFDFAVSFITEIELLGRFSVSKNEKEIMQNILNDCSIIEMNFRIKDRTIWIRERYKLKIPDAIIAATSLEYKIPLITSDKDFEKIKELNLIYLEKK